jgi:hypothetical protein
MSLMHIPQHTSAYLDHAKERGSSFLRELTNTRGEGSWRGMEEAETQL